MPFSEETIRRERLLQELMEGFDPVMLNLLLSLLGTYALICIGARVLHRYFLYLPDKKRYMPREVGLADVE